MEDFVRGEDQNDQAVRDVFKLQDRGKRKLALRYEFTFQLKRLAQNKKLPYKRYQMGYNFRDEPIRQGRTRQFIQCDGDVIGSTIKDEAENFSIITNVMKKINIDSTIFINNRKLLNEILEKADIPQENRKQAIREIDKLDKLSKEDVRKNLKPLGAEKILDIFFKPEKYFERYDAYSEILELKKYCRLFGVEVKFRPFLARGFSYYNGTVFEVWAKKIGVAIGAGGSYMINGMQSTGISFGLEPIFLISKVDPEPVELLVVSLNQDKKSIQLAQQLRKLGKKVVLFSGKPSKALEYANSYKIKKVVFVGKKEVQKKVFMVKDMKTGKQKKLVLTKVKIK